MINETAWIMCDDQMPAEDGSYLWLTRHGYTAEYKYHVDSDNPHLRDMFAWIPLPTKPIYQAVQVRTEEVAPKAADETDWCPNCGGDTDPLDPCEVCHDKGVVKAADEREGVAVQCSRCGIVDDSGLTPRTGSVLCNPHDWQACRPSQDAPTGGRNDR